MSVVSVYGVDIHDIGPDEVSTIFARWLAEGKGDVHTVYTPNAEFLLAARTDKQFAALLNTAHLSLPDGVGPRFASAALSDEVIRHRVPGVEALTLLALRCAEANKRLLLLGAQPSIDRAAAVLRKQFDALDVVTIDPGVVNRAGDLSASVLRAINEAAPSVIAVGLGQGKQEACIAQYAGQWPSVRIAIGVGGAFAMLGNVLPRAPKFLRRAGLEWMWRLCIEPRRAMRISRAVVVFPVVVVWTTLRERRFFRAVRNTVPQIFLQLRGK